MKLGAFADALIEARGQHCASVKGTNENPS